MVEYYNHLDGNSDTRQNTTILRVEFYRAHNFRRGETSWYTNMLGVGLILPTWNLVQMDGILMEKML